MVGHSSPGMVGRRRLRKPDVPGVSRQLASFEGVNDCVLVTDLAASRIDGIGLALHRRQYLLVEEALVSGYSGELIVTTSRLGTIAAVFS